MKALALLSLVTVSATIAALHEARDTAPVLVATSSVEVQDSREEPPAIEPLVRRAVFGGVPAVASPQVTEASATIEPTPVQADNDSGDCIPEEDDRCPNYPGYVSDDDNGCPDIAADENLVY